MPFKAIKGTFHVKGYSPDGDSVRFEADNLCHWNDINGRRPRLNSKDHVQLRIEAIDTLETHYKKEHQPKEFADTATNTMFELLGIENVVWNSKRSRVRSADDGVPGYIITRTTERFGRPVSFLFNADVGFEDGQEVFLDTKLSKQSINYKMLESGQAYPAFYDGMFYDLREAFADATSNARENKKGLWEKDISNDFFSVKTLLDITEEHVIFPKLFRRLTAHMLENSAFDAHAFKEALDKKSDRLLILSILHFTHFDNIIDINDEGQIKMRHKPENLVFIG